MGHDHDRRYQRERQFHDERYTEEVREAAVKYYSVTSRSRMIFEMLCTEAAGADRSALEVGCGPGGLAPTLAEQGSEVTAIDISSVAIERAEAGGSLSSIQYVCMNCEAMEFADKSFDLVCGSGILHHLDAERAYREIARVLKPGGRAVFVEPLGHNPVINLYRRLTPAMRTADEHPLRREDLEVARRSFDQVQAHCFDLFTLAAVPLRRLRCFPQILERMERLDQLLLRAGPLRWHAWTVVLVLRTPSDTVGPA